jgi:hypothetical protein
MMNMDDPWRSARDAFEWCLLPTLKQVGKRVGAAATAGDEQAKRIIHLYEMLHRSFDPLTFIQLDEALADWLKKQADAVLARRATPPKESA